MTVAVSGGILRWFAGGYSAQLGKEDFPVALSTKEFVIVKALVELLLPADGSFPSGLTLAIPQRIDEEVWAVSRRLSSDLKNGLQVLEHAPPMVGFYGRFSSLPIEKRADCFSACLKGSNPLLRQISVGFKQMIHFFYYARPEVWPAIGYEGPFIPKPVPPASHLAYGELLAARKERA